MRAKVSVMVVAAFVGCCWWILHAIAAPDKPEARPPREDVQISYGAAGAVGSELSWVELRHIGSKPIDIEGLRLASADGSSLADVRIEVIRGACELHPGEEALLIISPGVPTDDQARLRYRNLYRAESVDSRRRAVPAQSQSLTLIDSAGSFVAAGLLGPAPVGMCCDRIDCSNGDKCGDENMCAAQVTKAMCCADKPLGLHGCVWWEPEAEYCQQGQCDPGCLEGAVCP